MISPFAAFRAFRSAVPAQPKAGSAEKCVADLLRVQIAVRHNPPDGWTRRVALFTAYEDLLLQVCELHGMYTTALHLLDARPSYEAMSATRRLARIRTEADLEAIETPIDL